MSTDNATATVTPIKIAPAPAAPRKAPTAVKKLAPDAIRRNAGVVEQVKVACSRQYRLATLIGALLGAAVPFSTYMIAHYDFPGWPEYDAGQMFRFLVCLSLVAGGLLYSAKTVFQWGELALSSRAKAYGFTVIMEGVMTFSTIHSLAIMALVYLCAINAIATGVTLARGTPAPRSTP